MDSRYLKSPLSIDIHSKNVHFIEGMITISVLLGIVASFNTVLPPSVLVLAVYGLLAMGYAGIFMYYVFWGLCRKREEHTLLSKWGLIGIYLLLIGFIMGNPLSSESRSTFLHQDLRYFMYVTLGIIVSNKEFRPWLLRFMNFIGIVSVIFGILSFVSINVTTTAMARYQVWTLPYYYWWLSGSCFAINYSYMRMSGNNKFSGIGSLLAYVICGALFLKKAVFVNLILLLFICEIFAPSSSIRLRGFLKRLFKAIILLLFLVGLVYLLASKIELLQNLLDLISLRFKQAGDSYDRLIEFQYYLNQASPLDLLFGKGYGNYANLLDQYVGGYYQANAMHVGLADIPYVGGLFYSIVWIAILITVLKRIKVRKYMDLFQLACLAVTCLSCLSMWYEFSRSNTISPFFAAIAFATTLKKYDAE